MNCKHSWDPNM